MPRVIVRTIQKANQKFSCFTGIALAETPKLGNFLIPDSV